MFAADNPLTQQLLDAADRDEQTLQFPVPDEIFGFHVQQAIEKLLKALITVHGDSFDFIHDLAPLKRQLTGLGEEIQPFSLEWDELTAYGVLARYTKGKPLSSITRDVLRREVAALRVHVVKRRLDLKTAGVLMKNSW